MKKIYGKKALTGIEQVMILVLILLTLGAVFMAMYKGDILTKIRNLPSYGQASSGGDDEIIDQVIASGLCPVKVGELGEISASTTKTRVMFCVERFRGTEGCKDHIYSGMELQGDSLKAIPVRTFFLWLPLGTEIGLIRNHRFAFFETTLSGSGKEFKEVSYQQGVVFIPTLFILNNLENAWILPNGDICRESLVELDIEGLVEMKISEAIKNKFLQEVTLFEDASVEVLAKKYFISESNLLVWSNLPPMSVSLVKGTKIIVPQDHAVGDVKEYNFVQG